MRGGGKQQRRLGEVERERWGRRFNCPSLYFEALLLWAFPFFKDGRNRKEPPSLHPAPGLLKLQGKSTEILKQKLASPGF